MSQSVTQAGVVPEWTQPDRLVKARRVAGLTVEELSVRAGISEKTIYNYEAGRVTPRRSSIIAWSFATGVDLGWLETGNAPRQGGPDEGREYTAWDSNPEPTDYAHPPQPGRSNVYDLPVRDPSEAPERAEPARVIQFPTRRARRAA